MNNRGPVPAPGSEQSALSLLVNAADSHDPPRGSRDVSGGVQVMGGRGAASLADTLRFRGLTGEGPSFEEQFFMQQAAAQSSYNAQSAAASMGLLNQLREQQHQSNLFSQLGQQQQQLAALLGLSSPAPGPSTMDVRSALAAQLRQNQQQQQLPSLTHADILALSRSNGISLSGLSGMLTGGLNGGGGLASLSGLAGAVAAPSSVLTSDLESLHRLEELERRQRLFAATGSLASAGGGSLLGLEGPSQSALNNASNNMNSSNNKNTRQQQIDLSEARSSVSGASAGGGSMEAPSNSIKPKPAGATQAKSTVSQHESASGGGSPLITSLTNNTQHTASSNNNSNNKDELEKTPGSVIVPCRARGMPMDHNFKTAYFVIPENVRHGEELICSYFACRNAGIKFRYCSHCKVPVAKRNFRKRHKHGNEDLARDLGDDSGDDDAASPVVGPTPVAKQVNKGIPMQITAISDENAEADGISSQSADEAIPHSLAQQHKKNKRPKSALTPSRTTVAGHVESMSSAPEVSRTGAGQASLVPSARPPVVVAASSKVAIHSISGSIAVPNTSSDKIDEERRRRWATLLSKRPATKDGDSMSTWLMEVLAVSDLETPLIPLDGCIEKKQDVEGVENSRDGDEIAGDESEAPAVVSNEVKSNSDIGTDEHEHDELVKKKRPSELMNDLEGSSEAFTSGSFAEWKERKKQKKQQQTSVTGEAV